MKRISLLVLSLLLTATVLLPAVQANAAFNPNMIINDTAFDNSGSMNAGQIDAFLNSFPSSCISPNRTFLAPLPTGYTPSGGFTYGGNVTAGTVIAEASQVYGINPRVLLVTLQKEQSLVAGDAGCTVKRYAAATGYGCPDSGTTHDYAGVNLYTIGGNTVTAVSGTCVNSAVKAGFSQQVIRAAWLLKFSEERSKGNTSWAVIQGSWDNSDDPGTCYGGAMTAGYRKRCSSDPAPVFYDGYTTIDGASTFMGSGATASLYRYTPHFHGNQNFYNLFLSWFGDPNSPCYNTTNVPGATTGPRALAFRLSNATPTNLALSLQNNTGSGCAELHVLGNNHQSWITNIATGMRATDPASGALVPMRTTGTKQEGLTHVLYNGGAGTVEIHKLSPNLMIYPGYYDVPTNLAGVTPTSGMFVGGDFFGRGYDQLAYVLYSGSGGRAEIHMFDPSLRMAVGYYDVATNLSGVSAATGTFVAGDFLGRGYDQLAYVLYNGANNNAEIHMFDPSLQRAIGFYDVPTNLGGVSAATGTFVAGDFLGRGYDQLAYVLYNGTGGKAEIHTFTPDLTKGIGFQDIVTGIHSFNPDQ